jgi:hypothetical protein
MDDIFMLGLMVLLVAATLGLLQLVERLMVVEKTK